MYVAMTRAKEMIFFVNRLHDRSEFVDEVMEICEELKIRFNEDIFNQGIKPCPECQEKGNHGFMQLLKNREDKSIFLGCNFFFSLKEELQCRYTENVVPCMKCKLNSIDSELKVIEKNLEYFIVCESCNYSKDFETL
jgi:hypothetical protein